MDIEEKSKRDLMERYKRLEKKDSQQRGALAPSKNAVSQKVKDFLRTPNNLQIIKKLNNSVVPAHQTQQNSATTWVKPKPKAVEEDEYYQKVEEIIRRDFYPDLVKLEALREYEQYGLADSRQPPSILLKSTGKSRLSGATLGHKPDPVDDFIAMKRAELGLRPIESDST